jgi:ABC-type nickel/cobalt efflux system permease component RcnA
MNKLAKLFLLLSILNGTLFACAMCKADIPEVVVDAKISHFSHKTDFNIKWKFTKSFMDTLSFYDINQNKIFEENEKKEIENVLIDYLVQFNYLTNIEYIHKSKKFAKKFIKNITPSYSKLNFTEAGMVFNYTFSLDMVLKKDQKLYFNIHDYNGNFKFKIKDVVLNNYKEYKRIEPRPFNYYIYFYDKQSAASDTNKENSSDTLLKKAPLIKENMKNEPSFLELLSNELEKIKQKLELLLKDIKQNNSVSSYIWLLLFSLLYGIVHALGPGHGKSLVGSYFLSRDNSYMKAFSIASLIGIVHTFSAFILTLIIYNLIGFIFNDTLSNIEQVTIKISAVIIILIGVYLLYKKINYNSVKNMNFSVADSPSLIKTASNNHTSSLSCSCNACKTTATDLGVILAAGIIPCPGTVTIFIFTMSLGIYFVGFLSAVFMSIGMSLIIFTTALVSIKIKNRASRNEKLVKIVDYGSLIFILLLGVILFFIA